jgi:hypothetical protein
MLRETPRCGALARRDLDTGTNMLFRRSRWVTRRLIPGTALLLASVCFLHALPPTQAVRGEVLDEKSLAIAGAVCSLTGRLLPAEGLTSTTDLKGQFEFLGLQAGEYSLLCAAASHEPLKRALEVTDTPPPFLQVVLPPEIVIRQHVEVHEQAPSVSTEQSAPPARLSAPQLTSLPLVEQKFKAALPYVPGVVRTPDGKINIKGVPENQGLLLVDSAETADPVTGSFAIDVPVVAIDSLQVFKNAYNAQYGGFTGGLTTIHTRPPSDRWQWEVQNLTPNPRIKSGTLVGIADYNPRLYFTGPLLANRLSFSESLAYDIDKQPVRGLAWPKNEIKTHDFNSFTDFQYVFSPRHLMNANVQVFPLRRQFANINSLIPQTASSDYGQKGFSVGLTDQYVTSTGGILTTLVHGMRFDSNGHGQGPLDMLVTPNGWDGNFFNAYQRNSHEEEILERYKFPQQRALGKHELTLGGSFLHRFYHGSSNSHPVLMLRPDGTVTERIDFLESGSLSARDFEGAFFVADHWVPTDPISFDFGLRYSGQTLGGHANIAPRVGFAYSPGHRGKTVFRGGFGRFFDHSPLLAGDFSMNPVRTISFFDEQGNLQGSPVSYQNAYGHFDGKDWTASPEHLNTTPYNWSWSLEADRELNPRLTLRLSYISSRAYSQFIVNPVEELATGPALLLTDQGSSRYREFESTLHIRLPEAAEWNLSYVYSKARGDLNSLAEVYVPFEQPVIRANAYSNLPSDTPQRVVTWGRFKTHVWGITANPVIDYHSGLPYAIVDVRQDYVGQPNTLHFPRFFSLDLKLSKEFHLPFPWLRKHLMRGALTVFNVTDHTNPRDVFNNISSPVFGHFAGLQHRFLDTSLDVLY